MRTRLLLEHFDINLRLVLETRRILEGLINNQFRKSCIPLYTNIDTFHHCIDEWKEAQRKTVNWGTKEKIYLQNILKIQANTIFNFFHSVRSSRVSGGLEGSLTSAPTD